LTPAVVVKSLMAIDSCRSVVRAVAASSPRRGAPRGATA
jgi:hypothetical protein